MPHPNELLIPPKAQTDPKGVELLRAWGAAGGLHISLAAEVWPDAGHWGIMLADVVRHLADAYHSIHGTDPAVTTERILALFQAEWESPTDTPTGRIVEP